MYIYCQFSKSVVFQIWHLKSNSIAILNSLFFPSFPPFFHLKCFFVFLFSSYSTWIGCNYSAITHYSPPQTPTLKRALTKFQIEEINITKCNHSLAYFPETLATDNRKSLITQTCPQPHRAMVLYPTLLLTIWDYGAYNPVCRSLFQKCKGTSVQVSALDTKAWSQELRKTKTCPHL